MTVRSRYDGYTAKSYEGNVRDAQFVVALGPEGTNPMGDIADILLQTAEGVGDTILVASSGNKANAEAAAALAAAAGSLNYLTGFDVHGSGATTGLPVLVTVTGLLGGTLTYIYVFVAGVLVPNEPLSVRFDPPVPASAENTAITVTCPASGAGGTHNTVNIYGYTKSFGDGILNFGSFQGSGNFMLLLF